MKQEYLRNAIETYFKVLAEYGRTVDARVSPMDKIIELESGFLDYLDLDDLYCMFCFNPLIVIQIDYKLQRPVWGCRECRFTKGLQKIKWLDHCGDCGVSLNLDSELLKDQKKHLKQDNVISVCDRCIGNGNILQEEDMKNVHKKEFAKA